MNELYDKLQADYSTKGFSDINSKLKEAESKINKKFDLKIEDV